MITREQIVLMLNECIERIEIDPSRATLLINQDDIDQIYLATHDLLMDIVRANNEETK